MNTLLTDVCFKLNFQLERLNQKTRAFPDENVAVDIPCIQIGKQKRPVEIRQNLYPAQVLGLLPTLCRRQQILCADYFSPTVVDLLVKNNIEFIDRAGNMFLHNSNHTILIQNCEKPQFLEKESNHGRAFSPTGLKLVFLLLTEPQALDWNYRKLGEYAGVSLGSVKYIMTDLHEQGFLLNLKGKLSIANKKTLLERWTRGYIEKLYPKISVECYDGEFTETAEKYSLLLSGESAAAELHLITPAKFCLYRTGNINELIMRNRWKRTENGTIEIRTAFWPENRNFERMVPYLLVYADLLAENDSRCTEVAQIIYEKYLEL